MLFFPLVKGFLLLLLLDLSTMCQRHRKSHKIRKTLTTEVKIGFYWVIADEDVEGFVLLLGSRVVRNKLTR